MNRALDILFSSAALIVLAPTLLLIAALIRLVDGRPVLFRHERVGRCFEPFDLLKFRTMRSSEAGLSITVAEDDRITSLGGFLRRWKLDETPQLLNVLRGDMSLVGPRPEVVDFVELFPVEYAELLRVRPGITDPASLEFRHEQDALNTLSDPLQTYIGSILPQKLELSLRYTRTRTMWTDLQILAMTGTRLFSKPEKVSK